jgi:hypothetical protein
MRFCLCFLALCCPFSLSDFVKRKEELRRHGLWCGGDSELPYARRPASVPFVPSRLTACAEGRPDALCLAPKVSYPRPRPTAAPSSCSHRFSSSSGSLASYRPPPRVHRRRYHGILAPNAKLRAAVTSSSHTHRPRSHPLAVLRRATSSSTSLRPSSPPRPSPKGKKRKRESPEPSTPSRDRCYAGGGGPREAVPLVHLWRGPPQIVPPRNSHS